jgi:hypothetical protein
LSLGLKAFLSFCALTANKLVIKTNNSSFFIVGYFLVSYPKLLHEKPEFSHEYTNCASELIPDRWPPTIDRRLLTADCQLPTADRRLPTADRRPPTANYLFISSLNFRRSNDHLIKNQKFVEPNRLKFNTYGRKNICREDIRRPGREHRI